MVSISMDSGGNSRSVCWLTKLFPPELAPLTSGLMGASRSLLTPAMKTSFTRCVSPTTPRLWTCAMTRAIRSEASASSLTRGQSRSRSADRSSGVISKLAACARSRAALAALRFSSSAISRQVAFRPWRVKSSGKRATMPVTNASRTVGVAPADSSSTIKVVVSFCPGIVSAATCVSSLVMADASMASKSGRPSRSAPLSRPPTSSA